MAASTETLEPPPGESPGLIWDVRTMTPVGAVPVTVGPLRVHSTGILATFVLVLPAPPATGSEDAEQVRRLIRGDRTRSDGALLFGARAAGGAWCSTTTENPYPTPPGADRLHLAFMGGGNRRATCRFTYWIWPILDEDLSFFARWGARGVPLGEAPYGAEEIGRARGAARPQGGAAR